MTEAKELLVGVLTLYDQITKAMTQDGIEHTKKKFDVAYDQLVGMLDDYDFMKTKLEIIESMIDNQIKQNRENKVWDPRIMEIKKVLEENKQSSVSTKDSEATKGGVDN